MKETDVREWEQVEIERSRGDALSRETQGSALRFPEATIERYMNPPAATAFPLEYAYHLLGDVRGKRVLDFGCGAGENSLMLALRGARVFGMDISAELLAVAKQRFAVNELQGGGVLRRLGA